MRISDWSSDVCSSDLRCLQLQGFALFHQRAHPISLAPLFYFSNHAAQYFVAPGVVDKLGQHRAAPGRQLVDGRNVEIRKKSHGQRARYGGGAHVQLMWNVGSASALFNLRRIFALATEDRKRT